MKKLIFMLCLISTPIFAKEYKTVECNGKDVTVELKKDEYVICESRRDVVKIYKKTKFYFDDNKFPLGIKKGDFAYFRKDIKDKFEYAYNCVYAGGQGPNCDMYACSTDAKDEYGYVYLQVTKTTGEVYGNCP